MRPTLTLVPGCGSKIMGSARAPTFARVEVGTQVVPTNSSDTLKLQNPLSGNSLPPLGNGLRLDFHESGQLSFGAAFGKKAKGSGFHENRIYTDGLQMSTGGSLPLPRLTEQYQPMVDVLRRTAPAPSPEGYKTFAEWLQDATDRRGMASELARFCDVERQNVRKWQDGSLPSGPRLRRAVADWAQIEYADLRDLIDRDEEARSKIPVRARRKKLAAKPAKNSLGA